VVGFHILISMWPLDVVYFRFRFPHSNYKKIPCVRKLQENHTVIATVAYSSSLLLGFSISLRFSGVMLKLDKVFTANKLFGLLAASITFTELREYVNGSAPSFV